MKVVGYYGIHFDESRVAWLEQGRGGTNAISLREKSPFLVKLGSGRKHCNHQMPLAVPTPNDRHWDMFMSLLDDPLVRAMLPFPKKDAGLYYIAERERLVDFFVMLSRMTSPIYPAVVPFWTMEPQAVVHALGESNIQPLVLTGAKLADLVVIRQVATVALHAPRKMIISGVNEAVLSTAFQRIDTHLTEPSRYDFNELNALPWEILGAVALRKWMRGEWEYHQEPR